MHDVVRYPLNPDDAADLDKNDQCGLYSFFNVFPPERLWSSYIDLNLPEECFAPEPFQFEKEWVNFFWREKSVDQCDFRRRRLLAYTIQPLLMIFIMLGRFVLFSVFAFALYRGLNIWPILLPHRYDTFDVIAGVTSKKSMMRYFKVLGSAAVPFALLPYWALLFLLGFYFLGIEFVIIVGLTVFALIATPLVILVLTWFLMRFEVVENLHNFFSERREQKALRAEALQKKQDEEDRMILSCAVSGNIRTIRELPKKKKTISLRFQELKSRVCRPFAR